MTPERWTQVKDILSLALKRPSQERSAVVADACGDDAELRAEINELLAGEAEMGSFLAEPLLGELASSGTGDESLAELKQWTRYEVIECVGRGGMAAVYKARDPRLNRLIAIKLISGADDGTVQRFLREAEAQARINHENVLKVYETGVIDTAGVKPRHYIAMQFVDGPTLLEVREETTLDRKVELMLAIAEGLHDAHRQGLVHRDIKPSNILVERGSEGDKPYLLDFGLAVELGAPGITKTGVVLGTPRYMPPERIRGGTVALDRRSDIYSLGATYYEFIAGTPPFASANGLEVLAEILQGDFHPLRKHQPGISSELEAIVSKCLEADPQHRYPSARALADDLRRYLDGDPVLARPAGVVERVAKRARKHPHLAAAFALLAVLTLTMAAWGGYSYWRSARQAELAQQLGQEIRDLDWLFRAAQMSPLHSIAPQKQQVRERMQRLESTMAQVGSLAVGPGNYALGRGFLTLGDNASALQHLERAWHAGYQTADASMALGLAHSEVFRVETERAQRIGDDRERTERVQAIEVNRDRALHYLNEGRASTLVPARYVDALIAANRDDASTAIRHAVEAARETPWLFEAKLLSGHLQFKRAVKMYLEGKLAEASAEANEADRSYAEAARIAASSIDAYLGRCGVTGLVLHMVMHRLARDPHPVRDQAEESCSQALIVDGGNAEAHRLYADAIRSWAGIQVHRKKDAHEAYERAAQLVSRATELSGGSLDSLLTLADTYLDRAWGESMSGKDSLPAVDQAVAIFEKAIAVNPRSVSAVMNMGQAYVLRSRLESKRFLDPSASQNRAVSTFQQALRIDPLSATGFRNLERAAIARAQEQTRRGINPDAGLKEVVAFIEQAPGDAAQPSRVQALTAVRAQLNTK